MMIFHGANLIPEGLETGEFKIASSSEIDGLTPLFIIAYTGNPTVDELTTQTMITNQGGYYNGVPSGLFFCVCNRQSLISELDFINNVKGKGQSIECVFAIPAFALVGLNNMTLNELLTVNTLAYWISGNFKANAKNVNLITPTTIDGYTPNNKKLLTYPYVYLGFNPQNGSQKIYRYENFSSTPSFKMYCEINPNPSIFFVPQNYNGKSDDNLMDSSILSGYPQISWVTDYFNAWLAQNSNIINLQMQQENYNYQIDAIKTGANAGADMIGKSLSLNVVGAFQSSVNAGLDLAKMDKNHEFYVKNQMAQIERQQMLPNTSHLGTSATLLGYDLIDNDVFTRYNIKAQFAEKIDRYFDMYGYQTNMVKIPNINNRPNWNYVKLEGANILGNIPQIDLQEIKELFNNGITLWHNTSNFLDYSVNNR